VVFPRTSAKHDLLFHDQHVTVGRGDVEVAIANYFIMLPVRDVECGLLRKQLRQDASMLTDMQDN
jgi:hypothetical protein